MVAEAYLLPLPTADPGTWAPMSPAQVRPGCVLWTPWRPRRKLKPEEKYDVREVDLDMEDLVSMCERRCRKACNLRSAAEDSEEACHSGSSGGRARRYRKRGSPKPAAGDPGPWIRTPARSGCGNPRGTPMAIGLASPLSRRRCPRRPPGRIRPPSPP